MLQVHLHFLEAFIQWNRPECRYLFAQREYFLSDKLSTVRNTAINRLRVKEYEKDHIAEFTEENVSGADRYVPMETLLILAERRKALLDIWPVLPKETQILLKGKYILGYTDQELACQLKCKPSSIRMKLTRARRAALLLLSERNEVKEHDKT